jgi:vacuolar protein sorting-associated protein 11
MVGSKRMLVTLGEEDGMRAPVVKVWDLERVDKVGMETPVLLRSEGAD